MNGSEGREARLFIYIAFPFFVSSFLFITFYFYSCLPSFFFFSTFLENGVCVETQDDQDDPGGGLCCSGV